MIILEIGDLYLFRWTENSVDYEFACSSYITIETDTLIQYVCFVINLSQTDIYYQILVGEKDDEEENFYNITKSVKTIENINDNGLIEFNGNYYLSLYYGDTWRVLKYTSLSATPTEVAIKTGSTSNTNLTYSVTTIAKMGLFAKDMTELIDGGTYNINKYIVYGRILDGTGEVWFIYDLENNSIVKDTTNGVEYWREVSPYGIFNNDTHSVALTTVPFFIANKNGYGIYKIDGTVASLLTNSTNYIHTSDENYTEICKLKYFNFMSINGLVNGKSNYFIAVDLAGYYHLYMYLDSYANVDAYVTNQVYYLGDLIKAQNGNIFMCTAQSSIFTISNPNWRNVTGMIYSVTGYKYYVNIKESGCIIDRTSNFYECYSEYVGTV